MDSTQQDIALHSDWMETLFAHKAKTRTVFHDVLGLHEINHIAMAYVTANHTLLTLSSTPSIEYNLFRSPLWRLDHCYHPDWFTRCESAYWQTLYDPARYDELYYIKQTKPQYPLGLSLAARMHDGHIIYSVATKTDSEYTQDLFNTRQNELLQLGQYCAMQLLPLLLDTTALSPL
jgi:hypothetical protein